MSEEEVDFTEGGEDSAAAEAVLAVAVLPAAQCQAITEGDVWKISKTEFILRYFIVSVFISKYGRLPPPPGGSKYD